MAHVVVKRPVWTTAIGPWRSGPEVELTMENAARTFHFSLTEPDTASISLNGDLIPASSSTPHNPYEAGLYRDPREALSYTETAYINTFITDLWGSRNGINLFRGRCTSTSDDATETSNSLKAGFIDYRGVLDHRILQADVSYTVTDQKDIILNILNLIQSQPGGDLGITQGAWAGTVRQRTIAFKKGDTAWSCFKTLQELESGVELWVDSDLLMHLGAPLRSNIDNGAVLDYGGLVSSYSMSLDAGQYGNAIIQQADEAIPIASVTRAAENITELEEGRWDIFWPGSYSNVELRDAAADFHFNQSEYVVPTCTMTLANGAWNGPEHIWLGDIITYVVKRGRLNVIGQSRVTAIDITLDTNGNETVSVTIGKVRPSISGAIKNLGKRVLRLSSFT